MDDLFEPNLEEQAYLSLLSNVITNGSHREERGDSVHSIFGTNLRFDLKTFPLLTTKKLFVRGIFEELMFFLRGQTNTKILEAKGVNIWKGNTSKEFLKSKGLFYLPEGDMGKGYGYQWRNFGGTEHQKGVDQIALVLDKIKHNPTNRKMIVSAWNPQQLSDMALEPCHCFFQFYVNNNKLSCQWYQRSVDSFLGLPYNIASYALLTSIFAKACNLIPGELIFAGGDTHLYTNHFPQAQLQTDRVPNSFPTLQINKSLSSLEDILKLEFTDISINNYHSYPSIQAEMKI